MKKPKYLYIDDESRNSISSIINGLNDTGKVEVTPMDLNANLSYDDLIPRIKDHIEDGCDGILLDLCLNGEGVYHLNYSATPVAQYIRSLGIKKEMRQIPLVLCSTDANLTAEYLKDTSAHVLFDYKFVKQGKIAFEEIASRMKVLAEGYESIPKSSLEDLLGVSEEEFDRLDERIFQRFRYDVNSKPYEFTGFMVNDVFKYSGIMMSENVLASRLGVDVDSSKEEWCKLKKHLDSQIKYTGVFSEGWNLYWTHRLNEWFRSLSTGCPWTVLDARQRVDLINRMLDVKLIPAEPMKFASSSYFNTICVATEKPLDSSEGFVIKEERDLKPWQEQRYVSFYALSTGNYSEYEVMETEKKRFKEERNELKNEAIRDSKV